MWFILVDILVITDCYLLQDSILLRSMKGFQESQNVSSCFILGKSYSSGISLNRLCKVLRIFVFLNNFYLMISRLRLKLTQYFMSSVAEFILDLQINGKVINRRSKIIQDEEGGGWDREFQSLKGNKIFTKKIFYTSSSWLLKRRVSHLPVLCNFLWLTTTTWFLSSHQYRFNNIKLLLSQNLMKLTKQLKRKKNCELISVNATQELL